MDRTASGGPGHTENNLWPGQIEEKCGQYGRNYMPEILHVRQTL